MAAHILQWRVLENGTTGQGVCGLWGEMFKQSQLGTASR